MWLPPIPGPPTFDPLGRTLPKRVLVTFELFLILGVLIDSFHFSWILRRIFKFSLFRWRSRVESLKLRPSTNQISDLKTGLYHFPISYFVPLVFVGYLPFPDFFSKIFSSVFLHSLVICFSVLSYQWTTRTIFRLAYLARDPFGFFLTFELIMRFS